MGARRWRVGGLGSAMAFVFFAACGGDTPTRIVEQPMPPEQEARDTLPRQGLQMGRLYRLVDQLRAGHRGAVDGLLIMRNGEVVLDEYFRGARASDLHSLQSVSKSFASALLGIALENGHVLSLEEPVMDFFPQWPELGRDSLRALMKLEDILTMRTGSDYHENGASAPHFELNALPTGWDQYWLSRPVIRRPGTFWQYDSGGVIALSSVIKHRYGSHADSYADDWLFGPLGITRRNWFANQEGHPHLGGGLWLTQQDMVKLGQLYLQGGVWEGQQVVPESWVEASFERQVAFNLPASSTQRARWYGYLWWILEPDPQGSGEEDIRAAIGAGGQYVIVIPEHDMVVGITSDVQTGSTFGPIGFLYSDILPAVIR